jgi:hypothetical protein
MKCLLPFTDGIPEATAPDDTGFGEERIARFAEAHREAGASELNRMLLEEADEFFLRIAVPGRCNAAGDCGDLSGWLLSRQAVDQAITFLAKNVGGRAERHETAFSQ